VSKSTKQNGPLQNLFVDIKKILDFTEFKDLAAAKAAETELSKGMAEVWMNAIVKNDNYITYKKWWTKAMFQEISNNIKTLEYNYFINNPFNVPLKYRENLLIKGREAFLNQYVEQNDYYRKLSGLPPFETPESDYIYMSEELREKLHVENIPVHEMNVYIQNNYMNTEEYQNVLKNNPEKEYLKYLGRYKIDIYTARKAKDFDIIRYPSNRADINPNVLSAFASLYTDYREYVMVVLYNSKLEETHVNYRTFMGVLIISFALLQIGNKALESVNNHKYLDDAVLHTILSMYGIPESLLLTQDVRRDLAANILKLVRNKGTEDVYYDLMRILGYQDVTISKLMLMKGQEFDSENNNAALSSVNPYFLQLDLKDDNPYETIASGKAHIFDYHSIIDKDPTWWDLPDVQKILKESAYTLTDSKYIMIESVVHQMKYVFESIYFTRMILDNKTLTDEFNIEVPELFGKEMISVYDLILFVICATCMTNGLSGLINTETDKLLATAGFNFDLDIDSFIEFLNTTRYVDKNRIMKFLDNLSMNNIDDINRIFNDVMYPMREWLQEKISSSTIREEYVEYESIYRALYTYDFSRNKFLDDFEMPIETIKKKYNLSDEDLLAFKHFYPRSIDGKAVSVTEYNASVNNSRYHYPFLSLTENIDWYIHITLDTPDGKVDDRGYLYFHDILNSDNLLTLTNPDGTRVFMDYEDAEIGWEVNKQAVDKAISLISQLDDKALKNGYFQVYTPILNSHGKYYSDKEKLPATIRNSGIYKDILIDKIIMDTNGLATQPKTYFEALYRKNENLYNLLMKYDRFNRNKDAWMNDIMTIVMAIETGLNVHLKYFEQSVLGEELFFKPLITLIKHFKSKLVQIAKTGLKYVFDDKIDVGGNSNMFKMFDNVQFLVHFSTIDQKGYDSQFGFYDTERRITHHIIMKDRSEILRMVSGEGFLAETRESRMGSMRLVDEVKLSKNGTPLDPNGHSSVWFSGEPGTGRWSEEDDILMRNRKSFERIQTKTADLEGWKDFVESYVPN